jgi:hypothetical protein
MTRPWYLLLFAAVLSFATQAAFAHEKVYLFDMSGIQEFMPNASPGTGSGRVTVDLDLLTMHVEASFSDLIGPTSAAHIHCCDFQPNGSAGVATQTPSFSGFPLGVTSGTMDHTFDMTLASSYRAAFITANGGTVAGAFNALLTGMDNGDAYFNIHTNSFPGGEILGFAELVPEPTSALLCAIGLALPLGLRRRTRQQISCR